MDKNIYYTLHLIVSNLNRGNYLKAKKEFKEFWETKCRNGKYREICEKIKELFDEYTKNLKENYIIVIGDHCINRRLCLPDYYIALVYVDNDNTWWWYKYHTAETLNEAYRIAEKLARQYNAKIVYDFEQ